MSDEMTEIRDEFVLEAREHLAGLEPALLVMEAQGECVSIEVVNAVFRAIHSIKGGVSFLAYPAPKQLSHAMENVLMRVRDGQLSISSEVVDVLLCSTDLLRRMIDDLENSASIPFESEMNELHVIARRPVALDAQRTGAALGISLGSVEAVGPSAARPQSAAEALTATPGATETLTNHSGDRPPAAAPSAGPASTGPTSAALPLTTNEAASAVATIVPLAPVLGAVKPDPLSAGATAHPATLRERQPSSEISETLRVRVELLSRLMNVASELVLGRNQLLRLVKDMAESVPGLTAILQHIDRVTTELQEGVMQTRMQPIATLLGRQQRLVRDLSHELGKCVRLTTQGDDVELDKSILEALADPLTHIIRNSIDHGIELPAVRQREGKSACGTILLRAYHEGGQVNIEISDDGQGIDRAKVTSKAIERRLITHEVAAELSERDALKLVLLPGFSTANSVSDISGRGVGMDVVKTNVERLGGHVEIQTEVGHGTTIRLRLPLTLAIIASLIVQVGPSRFAVPQVNIVELVRIRQSEGPHQIERIQGAPVLRLRGRLLPLVALSQVLDIPSSSSFMLASREQLAKNARHGIRPDEIGGTSHVPSEQGASESAPDSAPDSECYVLVLRAGAHRYGVIVDELHEWEEIVVKPVPSHLKGVDSFAGTTILGDGCVIMILDTGGLASRARLSFDNIQRDETRALVQHQQQKWDGAVTFSIILLAGAPNEVYAVPQDRVLRLERIAPESLRKVGKQQYVQYRGRGLPVLPLDQCYPVSAVPADDEELYLVIPRNSDAAQGNAPAGGLLIWRILDALDVEVALQQPMFSGPGVLGCAVVHGELTTFIDPTALFGLKQAAGDAE